MIQQEFLQPGQLRHLIQSLICNIGACQIQLFKSLVSFARFASPHIADVVVIQPKTY